MTGLAPRFDHLLDMTDGRGTFEHACFTRPRTEHGYCTDDVARVLLVATREPHPEPALLHLAETSVRFLARAQGARGDYRNRMSPHGSWQDGPTVEDCWGRSIWGLGTAVSRCGIDEVRQSAMGQLDRAVTQRSRWLRATAFAVLGAAELLSVMPGHGGARALVADAAHRLDRTRSDAPWPWPEERLAYANAVLPEAMIAAGVVLERAGLVQRGLELLAWLVDHETGDGHVSVTPVNGSGPHDTRPAFDQQPIEVAALADACARAAVVDGDSRWNEGVAAAVAWFEGCNDGHVVMWDHETGGGYDGLQRHGPNLNQGTESTLALLSTMQHGRSLVTVAS